MTLQMVLNILCIIIFVLLILFFVLWQIKKNGLRKTIIDLIVEAEKTLTDNQDKFNQVCEGVINKLPFPFNLIPYTFIAKLCQKVFDEVKIALDYQKEA